MKRKRFRLLDLIELIDKDEKITKPTIIEIIEKNNLELLIHFMKVKPFDINCVDENENTPLMVAILLHKWDIVKFLLNQSDIDADYCYFNKTTDVTVVKLALQNYASLQIIEKIFSKKKNKLIDTEMESCMIYQKWEIFNKFHYLFKIDTLLELDKSPVTLFSLAITCQAPKELLVKILVLKKKFFPIPELSVINNHPEKKVFKNILKINKLYIQHNIHDKENIPLQMSRTIQNPTKPVFLI